MDFDAERLSELIGQIYDAAVDDGRWPETLAGITEFLEGHAALLFFVRDQTTVESLYTVGVDPHLLEEYAAYYYDLDPKKRLAFGDCLDKVMTDCDAFDEAQMDRSEFYGGFLSYYDLRYTLAAPMSIEKDYVGVVSSIRAKRFGTQGREHKRRFLLLVPHLRRALQLRCRQLSLDGERSGALDALANLGQGVILVDRAGTVVWANPAAEKLLGTQDGLATCRGRLVCASHGATVELRRLIATAADATIRPDQPPGGVMAVPRASLARPYHLVVTPLPGAAMVSESMPGLRDLPVAAVFVTDPENQPTPPADALAQLHGLTNAEAKLAAAFSAGTSLQDYAEEAELSLNYVRWLLKQIQAKTDTHTQAELIRLLVASQAVLLAPSE